MAITINTNMASLTAQSSLNKATKNMNTAMERLSTGLKINSSKDDAAGAAVVTKLDYKVNSLNVAVDNAQMGSSLLDTAEGTLNVVQSNLERIRDLTEQAANGTYGEDAMAAIKSEIAGRLAEIDRIADSTEFNGKKLLNGETKGINLQVGINADTNSVIELGEDLFKSAKTEQLFGEYKFEAQVYEDSAGTPAKFYKVGDNFYSVSTTELAVDEKGDVTTSAASPTGDVKVVAGETTEVTFKDANNSKSVANVLGGIFKDDKAAQAFLNNVDKALSNVTDRKTNIGAYQQRLSSAMDVANVMSTNLTSASSLIKDADIAKESSNYIKNQILQQTATSLLATANQNPNIALNLI